MKRRRYIIKKLLLSIIIISSIVFLAACASGPAKMELPSEAQKLSDVVPAMGEHWANPAQLPLGPIYLVHNGEVIGLEYMYSEDMMQEMSIPTPAGPEEFKALTPLPVGVKVDHVDVSFMKHGHEAFEVPHWDIHLYFISQEEKAAVMPGG